MFVVLQQLSRGAFEAEKIAVVWTYCKKRWGGGDKVFELKIEGWRKRGRPVKRWIDVVEEDLKKRRVVQQDAGAREDWRKRAVKELANPC